MPEMQGVEGQPADPASLLHELALAQQQMDGVLQRVSDAPADVVLDMLVMVSRARRREFGQVARPRSDDDLKTGGEADAISAAGLLGVLEAAYSANRSRELYETRGVQRLVAEDLIARTLFDARFGRKSVEVS